MAFFTSAVFALIGQTVGAGGALDGWRGLVAESSVPTLDDRIESDFFGSTFAMGLISDAPTYDAFALAANHDFPIDPGIDWDDELVVYVILEENTNRLNLHSYSPAQNGNSVLGFEWELIEPYYHLAFPALFHGVSRENLVAVDVVLKHETGDIALANLTVPPIAGDLDGDNLVDHRDIDILRTAVMLGSVNPQLNLDGIDGDIPAPADFNYLIESILGTVRGDGDLNGIVNFEDFAALATHFNAIGGGWLSANFNFDEVTNFDDFVEIANHFGMDLHSAKAAIPEPAGLTLCVIAVLMACRRTMNS